MGDARRTEELEVLRRQLAELDVERARIETRISELNQIPVADGDLPSGQALAITAPKPSVTNASPAVDKVALFRRLFGGRTDVFPTRWDNPKTGRSGYAPACSNEWVRDVCGKPQVKCGDCPNKAFIPMTGEVIECHLRGEDRLRPNGRGKATGPAYLRRWLPSWSGSRLSKIRSSTVLRPCAFQRLGNPASSLVPSFIRTTLVCRVAVSMKLLISSS